MTQLIECVPNFSEGRRESVIKDIVDSIEATPGVHVLNVDINKSANRSVVTFAGAPEPVLQSAFNMIEAAAKHIDMREHFGEHPRIGATDVCPLVPITDVSMPECVEMSKRLGAAVGSLLNIPVYLYEQSASSNERKRLPFIRRGQYEGFLHRMEHEEFLPDYGPPQFTPRSGVTVIGARNFLIGFNINLDLPSSKLAAEIASSIREHKDTSSTAESSRLTTTEGGLKFCRAIGWYITEYGCAQVSTNLLNYTVTPMHTVYEAVCNEANRFGVKVIGSELIGLAPLETILQSGKFYAEKNQASPDSSERDLIQYAIKGMGLNICTPFVPEQKILDYCIESKFGMRPKITYGSSS
jgi:glutamate formiminotransferase/formiminotetrahydrofolate cyclodeaminase